MMFKKVFLNTLLMFLCFSDLYSQVLISEYKYDENTVKPIGVILDIENNFVSVSNANIGSKSILVLTKSDSTHNKIWSKTYSTFDNSSVMSHQFLIDRDGNIVVVGSIEGKSSFVAKFNINSGAMVFAKCLLFQSSGLNGRYYRIIQLNKGYSDDYVLLGSVNSPHTHTVTRVNKEGDFIWSKEYDVSGGNELAYSVSQAKNNDIIVGCNMSNGSHFDQGIIRLNPSNGDIIKIQMFNLNNNGAMNGGFDGAIVIKNTKYICFVLHINGNGNTSRHGLALYNTETDNLEMVKLYNIGSDTRSFSLTQDTINNTIVIGGIYLANNSHFYQVVSINNFSVTKVFKLKNLNSLTGNAYLSMASRGNVLISVFKTNSSNSNLSNPVVGVLNQSLNSCNEEIKNNVIDLGIPSPSNPTISVVKNHNHIDLILSVKDNNFIKSIICKYCNSNTKKFQFKLKSQIDSVCFNKSYNWNFHLLNNNRDTINIILYKRINNQLVKLDSIKTSKDSFFKITYLPENEEYLIIGFLECSISDTMQVKLFKHKLSLTLDYNEMFYCNSTTINIKPQVENTNSRLINYLWKNELNDEILSTANQLILNVNKSIKINLKVSDNCAEAQTSSVVVYTVPQFVDSNILSNRIGCSPFATEFIYPKLNVRNDDYNYSLKWKWDINNINYDSVIHLLNVIPDNIKYVFSNPGDYQLRLELILPNGKICNVFSDTIKVIQSAIADFEATPSVIEIGEKAIEISNKSKYSNQYNWFIEDVKYFNEYEPKHLFNRLGVYDISLVAIGKMNCNDTLTKSIEVVENYNLFVPNAFNPNSFNSIWKPVISSGGNVKLQIFNRWGEKLLDYETTNPQWDGKYKGELCQEGVYLYLMTVKSKSGRFYYYKGTISLLK